MSKFMLFDFHCTDCGRKEEKMVTSNTHEYNCAWCSGGIMERVISGTSFVLDGTDPGYPTAYDKWAKQHERAGGRQDS